MGINQGEAGAGLNKAEAGAAGIGGSGMGFYHPDFSPWERIQELEGQLAAYERQTQVDEKMVAAQAEKRFSEGREWERRHGAGASTEMTNRLNAKLGARVVTLERVNADLREQVEALGTRLDVSLQHRVKLGEELAEAKSNMDNLRLEADQWRCQLKAADGQVVRLSQKLFETELLLAAERNRVAAFMMQPAGHADRLSQELTETKRLLGVEMEKNLKLQVQLTELRVHKTPISEFESAYRCGVRDVKRAMDKVEVSWKTS